MRGTFVDQGGLFSYIAPEARVPANHPLRKIRQLVRDVLGGLTRSLGRLYASEGRPSISARAVIPCAAASSVLRHPVGTPAHGAVGLQSLVPLVRLRTSPRLDPDTFTKNRDRLQTGAVFAKFMSKLLNHPEVSRCCRTSIFRWTER